MAGCNWCRTTEVKLAENKPYCLASNSKRECAVSHKPYPNLKFYKKTQEVQFLPITLHSCKNKKKASIENNRRKFGDTTSRQKRYVSNEESASSGEEKEEDDDEDEDEYQVEDNDNDNGDAGVKKEDHSNEASSKTKNVQKASTPSPKRQLTVMETLRINKMKQDKEAGDKINEKKMWQKHY